MSSSQISNNRHSPNEPRLITDCCTHLHLYFPRPCNTASSVVVPFSVSHKSPFWLTWKRSWMPSPRTCCSNLAAPPALSPASSSAPRRYPHPPRPALPSEPLCHDHQIPSPPRLPSFEQPHHQSCVPVPFMFIIPPARRHTNSPAGNARLFRQLRSGALLSSTPRSDQSSAARMLHPSWFRAPCWRQTHPPAPSNSPVGAIEPTPHKSPPEEDSEDDGGRSTDKKDRSTDRSGTHTKRCCR